MTLENKVLDFQKTGNYQYGKEILDLAYGWANYIIFNKYGSFGYRDDLLSESHDAIVSAINNFKNDKGKFSAYCSFCIKNRILNFIRLINNKNKYNQNKSKSYNQVNYLEIKELLEELDHRKLNQLFNVRSIPKTNRRQS